MIHVNYNWRIYLIFGVIIPDTNPLYFGFETARLDASARSERLLRL